MLELLDLYQKDIDEINETLYVFLESCGVHPEHKNTFYLLSLLNDITAMRKEKSYQSVSLMNGYIVGNTKIDGIIEDSNIPLDLARGYYRYEKGKFIIDEKKRQLMRGV